MVFVERFTSLKSKAPFRCYIDECGLKEIFGSIEKAREYVFSVVEKHQEKFADRDYLIAVAYGYDNKKIAEVFGYKIMGDAWPGNAEVIAWVFENNIYLPNESSSCENVDIARGEEGKHRRFSSDLEEFLKTVPQLGNLQPLKDSGIVEYDF